MSSQSSSHRISRIPTYPANGEHGVVCSYFLGTFVTSSTIGNEDKDTSKEGDTGHSKNKFLRPCFGVLGP